MGTTQELTIGRLVTVNTGRDLRAQLYAYTRSEQARVIELDRKELVDLIVEATQALATLDREQRHQLRELARRVENDLTAQDAPHIADDLRGLAS